jgi:hypothetical protein
VLIGDDAGFNTKKTFEVKFAGKCREDHRRMGDEREVAWFVGGNRTSESVIAVMEAGGVLEYLEGVESNFGWFLCHA